MKKLLLLLFSISMFSQLGSAQCTIDAGFNITGCAGTTFSITATATQFTSYVWSSSGTGSFSNATSLSSIYIPSTADISSGNLITLTITGSGGACTAQSSSRNLSILPIPSVNIGPDQTICITGGTDAVTLNPTAINAASIQWSTSGTGTFSPNAQTMNAIYIPSVADITAQSVTLLANVSANSCVSPVDELVVSFIQAPTVNVGFDQTSCGNSISLNAASSNAAVFNWTTNGSGTFSNQTTLAPSYTPSPADIANGSVLLTLTGINNAGCVSSDQTTLNFPPASVVNAGLDITTCPNTPINLSNASAVNTAIYQWSTSGTGTFSNSTILQPVYQPSASDAATGNVTLTLVGLSNSGCTTLDNLIVTLFNSNEHVHAGADQIIASGTAILSGTAVGTTSVLWSSNGSGTFNNTTSLNAIYTPSAADIANGIVKLKLTSTSTGICSPAEDELLLTIGSDLTLSGIITAATNKLDKGVVLLFKQGNSGLNFITSDTITSSDNGAYSFNHVPAGTYVLLASPANGSAFLNTYLPTYSGGTQTWETAGTVSFTSNFSYSIALSTYTSADPSWNTGTDIIAGFVDITADGSANTRITTTAVPAAYVIVYLTTAAGNKIAYTQTDKNGYYSFKNVKAGNYKISPEFLGTALAAGAQTSLPIVSDGMPSTTENGSMSLEERSTSTTGIINTTKSIIVDAYPNPAKNTVSINLTTSSNAGEINIFNETGLIKLQQSVSLNNPTVTLNIESLPAGIYLLQLVTEQEIYTSKIIKY